MSVQQREVQIEQQSMRLDKLLVEWNPDISRSKMKNGIESGDVNVNGRSVKANYKCQAGDRVEWSIPDVTEVSIEPENIPLDIVYEDQDVLIVNKPKGMVVHPAVGHVNGTLVNALLYYDPALPRLNDEERAGIVHRIDKDTSGLLMVAKTEDAFHDLSQQLQQKEVERTYEAIVHGVFSHEKGRIDAPIGRDPNHRQKMAVVEQGRPAITHFRVMQEFAQFSRVECRLETGRTHQIRVHMKYIDHPLVGDPKYGRRKTLDAEGQALHAKRIGFTHPRTRERLQFEVEIPELMQTILQQIEEMN